MRAVDPTGSGRQEGAGEEAAADVVDWDRLEGEDTSMAPGLPSETPLAASDDALRSSPPPKGRVRLQGWRG